MTINYLTLLLHTLPLALAAAPNHATEASAEKASSNISGDPSMIIAAVGAGVAATLLTAGAVIAMKRRKEQFERAKKDAPIPPIRRVSDVEPGEAGAAVSQIMTQRLQEQLQNIAKDLPPTPASPLPPTLPIEQDIQLSSTPNSPQLSKKSKLSTKLLKAWTSSRPNSETRLPDITNETNLSKCSVTRSDPTLNSETRLDAKTSVLKQIQQQENRTSSPSASPKMLRYQEIEVANLRKTKSVQSFLSLGRKKKVESLSNLNDATVKPGDVEASLQKSFSQAFERSNSGRLKGLDV